MTLSKLEFKRFSIELWLLRDIRGQLLDNIINTSIGKYFFNVKIAKYRKEHVNNKNVNLKKNIGLEILCFNPRINKFEKLLSKKDKIEEKDLHNAIYKIVDLFNKSLFNNLKGDFYYLYATVIMILEQKFIHKSRKLFRKTTKELVTRNRYEFEFSASNKK